MNSTYLAAPKPPPALHIPSSSSTVKVRVIDTNTLIHLKASLYWQPEIHGFDGHETPSYSFLISNDSHHVIFDLGIRKDWENYAPKIVSLIKTTTVVTPGTDVAAILNSDTSGLNIRSADIKAVIWSHDHFDHVGNLSTFPASTELVVGPGVRASFPGWPLNPEAGVLESDIQGRNVREISFDHAHNAGLKIGRFDALDFFGDGSFYLLDAPGHVVGHMCGLARTTADPPSFVVMGADACHHPGVLRPSNYLPLPRSIRPSPFVAGGRNNLPIGIGGSQNGEGACPGALLQQLTMERDPSQPFFTVARSPLFLDWDAAMETVTKVQEFDAAENVFVFIAHDASLRDKIPLFPHTINEWRANNLGTETRWSFCSDFRTAIHGTNSGATNDQVVNRIEHDK